MNVYYFNRHFGAVLRRLSVLFLRAGSLLEMSRSLVGGWVGGVWGVRLAAGRSWLRSGTDFPGLPWRGVRLAPRAARPAGGQPIWKARERSGDGGHLGDDLSLSP